MKKALSVFAVITLAITANASYLYWTVEDEYYLSNTKRTITYGGTGLDMDASFLYGRLHIVDSETGADNEITSGIIGLDGSSVSSDATTPGTYAVDISSYSKNASYYVEIIAYDNSLKEGQVGYTGSISYTDLANNGAVYNGTDLSPIDPAKVANIWHGAGANAPEPTSAMLMLLGVAGLALRRKQRKLA